MEKAKMIPEIDEAFSVQFNPAEYQIANTVQYAEKTVTGLDGAIQQFIAGSNPVLTLTLYFDTYVPAGADGRQESGTDVTKETKKVVKLMEIVGKLHRPQHVTFSWGSIQWKGILTNVTEQYTMFLSDGKPVRAKLDVTIKALYDVEQAKRSQPFESPDRSKYKIVHQGEYLWQYAYEEYKDPDAWKLIALENGLKHPLEITSGQVLRIPAL